MKFSLYRENQNLFNVFSVLISDQEKFALTEVGLAIRFRDFALTRLANIIAGYYFKTHKEEIIKFLETENLKELIAVEIAKQIKLELK